MKFLELFIHHHYRSLLLFIVDSRKNEVKKKLSNQKRQYNQQIEIGLNFNGKFDDDQIIFFFQNLIL